jgi:hypothetical protein
MHFLHDFFARLKDRSQRAELAYGLMYFGLAFYVLLAPLGMAPREIGTWSCIVGVVVYYLSAYGESNLKRFRLRYLYLAFWGFLAFKAFHSIHVGNGWYILQSSAQNGFVLFFAGLECVRSLRDLKNFTWLFAAVTCWQGLDGMYQYFTGKDFLKGEPTMYGRLTGTMSSPRVGNFMSLAMLPALGVWKLWPGAWSLVKRSAFMFLIMAPGMFLLVFSHTRSGYIGFTVGIIALTLIYHGLSRKVLLAGAALAVFTGSLLAFGPKFISYENVVSDGRWELWGFCIEIFKEYPILGTGINTFNEAYNKLGLEPVITPSHNAHPHNIYLQFLAETGIIGLSFLLIYLGTFILTALRHVRRHIARVPDSTRWFLTACLLCGFIGYTATAMSAHNYFRAWWLGIASAVLGMSMGASVIGLRDEEKAEESDTGN